MNATTRRRGTSKSPTADSPATAPARVRSRRKLAPAAPAVEREPPEAESAVLDGTRAQKRIRDRFSMPRSDFELLAALKERAIANELPAKKSDLLRAGLYALSQCTTAEFRALLKSLTPVRKKQRSG